MKLISRTEIPKPDITYNLHVENNHNYLANNIVVSNCHGLRGPILQDILISNCSHIPFRFGFTGSLPKEPADVMAVHVAVGYERFNIPAHELITLGVLSTLDIDVIQIEENLEPQYAVYVEEINRSTHPNIKKMNYKEYKHQYFGEYADEKKYLQQQKSRIEWIAEFVKLKSQLPLGNVLCLVHSIDVARKLSALVPGSYIVNGKDTKKTADREEIYKLYGERNGVVVFATVKIAGTGLSIDLINWLMYIDIGKAFTSVIQAIGRGLRKDEEKQKTHCNVVDICSDLKWGEDHLAERISYYKEAKYPYKKRTIKLEK